MELVHPIWAAECHFMQQHVLLSFRNLDFDAVLSCTILSIIMQLFKNAREKLHNCIIILTANMIVVC